MQIKIFFMWAFFASSALAADQIPSLSHELERMISIIDQDPSGCWRYVPRFLDILHNGPESPAAVSMRPLASYTKLSLMFGVYPPLSKTLQAELSQLRKANKLCPATIQTIEGTVVIPKDYGISRVISIPRRLDGDDQYFRISVFLNPKGRKELERILTQGSSWSTLLVMNVKFELAANAQTVRLNVTVDPIKLSVSIERFLEGSTIVDEESIYALAKALTECSQTQNCGLDIHLSSETKSKIDTTYITAAIASWLIMNAFSESIILSEDGEPTLKYRLKKNALTQAPFTFDLMGQGNQTHYNALGLLHCLVLDKSGAVRRSTALGCG